MSCASTLASSWSVGPWPTLPVANVASQSPTLTVPAAPFRQDEVCNLSDVGTRKDAREGEDDPVVYKIDVPANRYDLLCLEGLVLALRVFLGKEESPDYRTVGEPDPALKMTVKKECSQIRPFVVCCVLRGVTFDKEGYHSFLDLQARRTVL